MWIYCTLLPPAVWTSSPQTCSLFRQTQDFQMLIFLPDQSSFYKYFARKSICSEICQDMFFGFYGFIGLNQISNTIVHVGLRDKNFANQTSHGTSRYWTELGSHWNRRWQQKIGLKISVGLSHAAFVAFFVLHWTSSVVRDKKERRGEVWTEEELYRDVKWEFINWTGERESMGNRLWPCYSYSKKGRWTCPGGRERRGAGKVGRGVVAMA